MSSFSSENPCFRPLKLNCKVKEKLESGIMKLEIDCISKRIVGMLYNK
jgi:hypothetical protein